MCALKPGYTLSSVGYLYRAIFFAIIAVIFGILAIISAALASVPDEPPVTGDLYQDITDPDKTWVLMDTLPDENCSTTHLLTTLKRARRYFGCADPSTETFIEAIEKQGCYDPILMPDCRYICMTKVEELRYEADYYEERDADLKLIDLAIKECGG